MRSRRQLRKLHRLCAWFSGPFTSEVLLHIGEVVSNVLAIDGSDRRLLFKAHWDRERFSHDLLAPFFLAVLRLRGNVLHLPCAVNTTCTSWQAFYRCALTFLLPHHHTLLRSYTITTQHISARSASSHCYTCTSLSKMSATPSNASVEDFGKRSIDEQVDRADRAYRTHSAALISNLETRLGRRAEAAEIEACVKQDPLLASSPTPAKILRIGMESRAAKHRNPQAVAIMTQALQQQRQRQLGLSSGGSDNNVDLEQRLLRARNGAVDVLQLIEDLGPQPTLAEAERYIFDKQRSATATRDAAGILPRAVSSATLPTTPSFMPQVTQPIFSGATPSATSPVVPPATPYATPPHARPEIVLPTTPFTAPPVMQTAAAHTTPHATPSRIPVTSASRQYARPPTTSSITMSEERMRDVILGKLPMISDQPLSPSTDNKLSCRNRPSRLRRHQRR